MKKDIIINGIEFTFINENYSTSSTWGHKTKLFENNRLIGEGKAVYLNRTWEEYEFQSVMKNLVSDLIASSMEGLKEEFKIEKGIGRMSKKWVGELSERIANSARIKNLEELKKAL